MKPIQFWNNYNIMYIYYKKIYILNIICSFPSFQTSIPADYFTKF